MVFFETKAKISLDPIVGLVQKASEDTNSQKLLAIVGSAMDDAGKLIVPDALNQAALEIVQQGLNMEYAPSGGLKDLASLITEEFVGKDNLQKLYSENIRRAEVVTGGGTNAISLSLMTCTKSNDPIIVQRPHWAGYDSVALGIGRSNLINFELLDKDLKFNLDSLAKALSFAVKSLPLDSTSKITLILNTPFDNPLGKEISHADLMEIANLLGTYRNQKFLVILDIAYIDFGPTAKDYNKLSFASDFFKKAGLEHLSVIVASTLSKSFAMYGARVGAATLFSPEYENVSEWKDIAGGILRGTLSNLSRTSQEIALKILSDSSRLASIHEFQRNTVAMINKRREHFINKITSILPEELEMISPDGGFFLSFRLRNEVLERFPDFAKRLSESFISSSVYIPVLCEQFIRVPICGLREELLDLVAEKITEHTSKILGKVH